MPMQKSKSGGPRPKCVVSGTYAFVLLISRFFGLAPLKFDRTEGGWAVRISTPMCIYSFFIGTILVSSTMYGMIQEVMVGTKVSDRMNSRMSQIVSVVDVMMVVLTAAVGVYGAPKRMKRLLKIMEIMSSIDTSLNVEYSASRERNYSIGVSSLLLIWTSLLVNDFRLYANLGKKSNRQFEIIQNYTAFYLLYYIVFILELQFTYTAFAVNQRMRQINVALDHTTEAIRTESKLIRDNNAKATVNTVAATIIPSPTNYPKGNQPPVKKIGLLVDSLNKFPHSTLLLTKVSPADAEKMNGRRLLVTPSEAVHRLSDLHGSISAAIQHANAAYGHPLLIILVSTLLHLIVTPYFLISELSSSTVRKEFTILQFIWCAVHCLRLLLVVEPCHLTIFQGRRSSVLVCRMLGYLGRLDSDPGTLQAVDIFSKQVGMRAFDFTALGVCVLDRPLVATVAGAVTTYLVILLQFKKEDKK